MAEEREKTVSATAESETFQKPLLSISLAQHGLTFQVMIAARKKGKCICPSYTPA